MADFLEEGLSRKGPSWCALPLAPSDSAAVELRLLVVGVVGALLLRLLLCARASHVSLPTVHMSAAGALRAAAPPVAAELSSAEKERRRVAAEAAGTRYMRRGEKVPAKLTRLGATTHHLSHPGCSNTALFSLTQDLNAASPLPHTAAFVVHSASVM